MLVVRLLNVGLQQTRGLKKFRKNQNHTIFLSDLNMDSTIDDIKNEIEKKYSNIVKLTSRTEIVKIR